MTALQIFAYFGLPVIVMLIATVAYYLHKWDLERQDRQSGK
jgi:hypothetical protein